MPDTSRIDIGEDVRALFAMADALEETSGMVSNNLEYILALERGSSQQAPDGFVARRRRAHEYMLDEELQDGFEKYGPDLNKAIKAGVTLATLRIMRDVSDNTPVDTGRAKNAWVATLPSGKETRAGKEITAEQQQAIRSKIRQRDAKKRARDRDRARRILAKRRR